MKDIREKLNLNISRLAVVGVLVVLVVALSILSPNFLKLDNIINVMQQVTVNSVVAIGMTIVILTGGIDLSVGSVIALTGMVMAKLMSEAHLPWVPALLLCLLLGALCGTINGFLVAKCKLQPMIATLGMMSIARGAALYIANGRTVSGFSDGFRWLGTARIPGTPIPVQVVFMLLLFVLAYYLLKYRKFGRYIYAIGGNEESARLSGINVVWYKALAYTISGVMSTIASFILVSKLNSAVPTAGTGYELDAVASAVIGGISLLGGHGGVWGALLGAIIMGIIKNGLNLLNVSSFIQEIVIGVIIIAAVLVDSYSNVINKNRKVAAKA